MSDCSRPHCMQPTRLLHPWDFPGKSTGVGCHCLLHPSKTDSDNRSRYFLPIVSSYGLSFLLNIMLWGVLVGIWICNTIAISGIILLRKLLSFLFFLLFSIISFFFFFIISKDGNNRYFSQEFYLIILIFKGNSF